MKREREDTYRTPQGRFLRGLPDKAPPSALFVGLFSRWKTGDRGRILLFDVLDLAADAVLKVPDASAQRFAERGQLFWAEDEENDHEDDQQLLKTERLKHLNHLNPTG
jgi:hypothetical protein